jgi:glycosyltransferase involved in cell wall biosynthesis
MKPKIYVYPISNKVEKNFANPYIRDLCEALDNQFVCINKNKTSRIGLLNILKYFIKSNFFHLNWIEELPDKKGGLLQTVFFILILLAAKISGKKIIWTVHNKLPHENKNLYFKKLIMHLISRHAHYIITHSHEGIEYVKSLNPSINESKIRYIPHPVKTKSLVASERPVYDILIWGNIMPYKGIHVFLQHLKERNLLSKYKIAIIGKICDPDYERRLMQYASSNIIILNHFFEEDKLHKYIAKSKIILFTYQREYVLSSGVLSDSIGFHKPIIGPDIGAFSDLAKEGLIYTYQTLDELPDIIDTCLAKQGKKYHRQINDFIRNNSWANYGLQLFEWTYNIKSKRKQERLEMKSLVREG